MNSSWLGAVPTITLTISAKASLSDISRCLNKRIEGHTWIFWQVVGCPPCPCRYQPQVMRLTSGCVCKDTRLAGVDVDVGFGVSPERINRSSKRRHLRELWVPYALALLGSEVK